MQGQHCRPLNGIKLKDFEVFLEKYSDNIVEKWIDYFAILMGYFALQ